MSDGAEPKSSFKQFSVETLNNAVQTLAILGAGAWGIYIFIYEAKIVPGLAPPTVSVSSVLEKAGQRGDLVAIRSTVTRHNVGQTGVRLLGLTYNVVGIKVRFAEGAAATNMSEPALRRTSTVFSTKYYDEPEQGEIILRQGILFAGATNLPSGKSELNPGEAVSRDLIFYADRTRFDSIRFRVSLSYTKLSAPLVPLEFQIDGHDQISALAGADCRAAAGRCEGLTTTDFGTEFSLW